MLDFFEICPLLYGGFYELYLYHLLCYLIIPSFFKSLYRRFAIQLLLGNKLFCIELSFSLSGMLLYLINSLISSLISWSNSDFWLYNVKMAKNLNSS